VHDLSDDLSIDITIQFHRISLEQSNQIMRLLLLSTLLVALSTAAPVDEVESFVS
jgi:hypothetical protein